MLIHLSLRRCLALLENGNVRKELCYNVLRKFIDVAFMIVTLAINSDLLLICEVSESFFKLIGHPLRQDSL